MTVGELVDRLKGLPPQLTACVGGSEAPEGTLFEIMDVLEMRAEPVGPGVYEAEQSGERIVVIE